MDDWLKNLNKNLDKQDKMNKNKENEGKSKGGDKGYIYDPSFETEVMNNYNKNMNKGANNIKECRNIKQIINSNEFVMVYFGSESEKLYLDAFSQMALHQRNIKFLSTSDQKCVDFYEVNNMP